MLIWVERPYDMSRRMMRGVHKAKDAATYISFGEGRFNQFAHDDVDMCELCTCTRWCTMQMRECV